MNPRQARIPKTHAAITAIVLAGVMAGACTQQNPVSPTPAAANATSPDQSALTATAAANGEVVCHARGNGTFALLSVNANAVSAHLNHGDGRPLGPVPGSAEVFTSDCARVASVAGVWLGTSNTFDPGATPCGEDLNQYRLTLTQSGSDVSGQVYWKILQSYYPPDVGMEQTVPLTSGSVSGQTFTFSYGPPQLGLIATATFTDTAMAGTIVLAGSASCPTNTFTLVRQ